MYRESAVHVTAYCCGETLYVRRKVVTKPFTMMNSWKTVILKSWKNRLINNIFFFFCEQWSIKLFLCWSIVIITIAWSRYPQWELKIWGFFLITTFPYLYFSYSELPSSFNPWLVTITMRDFFHKYVIIYCHLLLYKSICLYSDNIFLLRILAVPD